MTSALTRDLQFDLDGYEFGCSDAVEVADWDPSSAETRDQDVAGAGMDARMFGRDLLTPPVWAFTLRAKGWDTASVLAVLAELRTAWDAEGTRLTPQAVLPLRYRLGGRTRRVFGRPRRFTPVMSNLIFGHVPVACDFALAEPWSYDDVEQTLTLSTGAVVTDTPTSFPLTFPYLWGATAGSPRHGQIAVAGARSTWLRLVITGPVGTTLTDPYVIISPRPDPDAPPPADAAQVPGAQVFQLRGVVGAQEQIVVSSLPWEQGVYRADGTVAAVTLDPTARLSQLRVRPGTHNVTFGGIDNTGSATCTFAWRAANTSI